MKTTTVIIQIGNSDDKLSQAEWSQFVRQIHLAVKDEAKTVHFMGCSPGDSPWQNCCLVLEVDIAQVTWIKNKVVKIRRAFNQTFLAWTQGTTDFI